MNEIARRVQLHVEPRRTTLRLDLFRFRQAMSLDAKPTNSPKQLRRPTLMGQFKYRGDTNYAKMDRVVHTGVEQFKTTVMGTTVHGMTVKQWSRVFASEDDAVIERALKTHLGLK